MTIIPATPAILELFAIEVKSAAAYTDISLVGGSSHCRYNGVKRCGNYYCWRWEDSWPEGGTYTYSFKIKSGTATCVSKSVTITAPTDTPTITPTPTLTPTPTPFYEFALVPIGPDRKGGPPGSVVDFQINLRHQGNREDTYYVWAQKDDAAGWTDVQFCIGDLSTCFAPADMQTVVLPPGAADHPLYIKAVVPAPGLTVANPATVSIWVQSLTSNTKKHSIVTIDIE